MSQRLFAGAGVLLAGAFGIFTSYSALQPEFQRIQDERESGAFVQSHQGQHAPAPAAAAPDSAARPANDKAISQAILSDLQEARDSITSVEKGSFAWGIRRWFKGEEMPNHQDNAQEKKS